MHTVVFTDEQFEFLQSILAWYEESSLAHISELEFEKVQNILALVRGQAAPNPGV